MNHFVTFEGIDGSGKSTILKLVYEQLKSQGYDVISTYEPTDSWMGKLVQRCIETNTDPFVTVFTFIADRIEHGKQIQSWIDDDKIVLCDRYEESTYAYQGVQLHDTIKDSVKWLKELSKNRIPVPDITFLFVIDPKKALDRIQNRDKLIPFERLSFLEQVHKNYLELAFEERFYKLDATKSTEELVLMCCEKIVS